MIFDVFGISDSQTLQFRHHFGNEFLRWEIRFFGFSKFRIFRAGFLRFRRSRARPEAFGRPRLGRELEPGRPFMDLLPKIPENSRKASGFPGRTSKPIDFLDFSWFSCFGFPRHGFPGISLVAPGVRMVGSAAMPRFKLSSG